MRPIRIVLLALFALLAAPVSRPSAGAQAPATTSTEAAAPTAAPPAADTAQPASAALQRYTPPQTLRPYAHVFVAFAIAWVLLFGYVVFIARKFRRVEEQVDALARS
jgi:CcmD family protein